MTHVKRECHSVAGITELTVSASKADEPLLQHLLNKTDVAMAAPVLPSVAIATVAQVDLTGQVWVNAPAISPELLPALSLCALGPQQVHQQCAIQFIDGDRARPLILGLLIQPAQCAVTPEKKVGAAEVVADGQLIHIEAAQELILRCGEASIVMTAEGVIELRGNYISSNAVVTQRLRGGSVQVN